MNSTPSPHPYSALTPDVVLDALDGVGYRGRRTPAGARQLRKPRLPGLSRRRAAARREVLPARRAGPTRRSSRSTRSSPSSRRARFRSWPRSRATMGRCTRSPDSASPSIRKCGGRAPELEDRATLEWMGRFLGRIHAVGARSAFAQRPAIDPKRSARARATGCSRTISFPRSAARVAQHRSAGARRRSGIRTTRAGDVSSLRLHGDCHAGNVLWTDDGPHFVDFDDARSGPAVQDLWMLLSGDRAAMSLQLGAVLDGYEDFARVRSARAASRRGAAHAAPAPLFGVACAALGRPGVSRRVPVVQHAALLAGPHPRAARAGRADGRAAAVGVRPSPLRRSRR